MKQMTGHWHETGQEFWLVVFERQGDISRAQLRVRNTPLDDWSQPLELREVPLVHPSAS